MQHGDSSCSLAKFFTDVREEVLRRRNEPAEERREKPIHALWRHVRRKMAGFLLREIWAIQAFVKEFCLPREGGEKTRVQTKAKRWVAELHTLAQPWIRALTRAVRIPALERLADLIQSAGRALDGPAIDH